MSKIRFPVGDQAFRLHPTKEGQEELDRIRKRKEEKKRNAELGEIVVDMPVVFNVREHDMVKVQDPKLPTDPINDLKGLMYRISRSIMDGQYRKALKHIGNSDRVLMTWFLSNPSFPDSMKEEVADLQRLILRVAKSYYEYCDPSQKLEFLSDHDYDGLLAAYLKNKNNVEPSAIIPKGKKEMTKVPITYQTLHNNMDKSYRIYEADEIPTGVKEQDTIEKFLMRAYASIGCSSEHKIKVEISPKIDGVSINGTLVNGVLKKVQTRGDTNESVAIPGLEGLRLQKNIPVNFGIQFEAFVTDKDRIDLSEYLGMPEPYVSCRHAAAGIISRLSSQEDPELLKYLKLYPIMTEGSDDSDYTRMIRFIQQFGVVPKDMIPRCVVEGTMKQLLNKIYSEFQSYSVKRSNLSYAIDGMVLTIVDTDYQKAIGREGRTNKYQIALKFNPTSADATVSDIWLDTGLKGYRTIQVNLNQPVFLDGVRYDHVPVLSVDEFEKLELCKDSVVQINRVGDVIPSITVKDHGTKKKLKVPNVCPTCGKELSIKAKKLYCSNPNCEDNIAGRVLGFITALDMTSYGRSFVYTLHDTYGVRSISDLFTFNEDVPGVKAGKKLMEFKRLLKKAVESHNDIKIISALGIPGIGTAKAKKLLEQYPITKLNQLNKLPIAEEERLQKLVLSIVGPETEQYAMDMLISDMFAKDVETLLPYVKKITKNFNSAVRVGHTGLTLSKEFRAFCEKKGFEIVDGKNFTVLIAQNHDVQTGKAAAARKRKVPIMTESEFMTNRK